MSYVRQLGLRRVVGRVDRWMGGWIQLHIVMNFFPNCSILGTKAASSSHSSYTHTDRFKLSGWYHHYS